MRALSHIPANKYDPVATHVTPQGLIGLYAAPRPVRVKYSDRVCSVADKTQATETHTVRVSQGGEEIAVVKVKVTLEFDEDGKIAKQTEEVL